MLNRVSKKILHLGMAAVLTFSMVGGLCLFAIDSRAESDWEKRRKPKPPEVEADQPVSVGQLCQTRMGIQSSSYDYYQNTWVLGAIKTASTDKTTMAAFRHADNLLKNVSALGSSLGDYELASAGTNPNKLVTVDVLSVLDLEATGFRDSEGKFEATLGIDKIQPTDRILVIHYDHDGWENIKPKVVGNGNVTFRSDTMLSQFAVLRFNIYDIAPTPAVAPVVAPVVPQY